ncbi:RCC1 domain-containing protein [Nannocystis radixulma]|uniref:Myxococcus cysteine-rich repeat-containing protein n=1 Tax=Nannocystis radixulma TaxID=2995305 RepID=A0ABT5BMB0_9BACT|nr:hypothetical protein [Nannocystis radixulma]MDC0675300.1 hypothetical protein [Nannocystis radixulma]
MVVWAFALFGCPSGGETVTDAADPTGDPTGSESTETTSPGEPATATSTTGDPTGDPATATTTTDDSTSGPATSTTTTGTSTTSDSTTSDSTTGDSTIGDSTAGDSTTGDSTTGDSTSGEDTTEGSTTGDAAPCGNGALDPGETCDDGDADDADACSATCQEQRVQSVSTGYEFTCALLSGGSTKCWGRNLLGELGQGDTDNRGAGPGEMGEALPVIDLGGSVVQVDNGSNSVCARFADGRLKCWGSNWDGELGAGDTEPRGMGPGEMGDALPFVDLGVDSKVVAMSTGPAFVCAVTDQGQVKCWGSNWVGQLGLGDVEYRGDEPGEMGDNLPPVDLGRTVKATHIGTGDVHACALLEGGSVKCWGRGNVGQLGLGDVQIRGDGPGEMGDALPAVDLGQGAVVKSLALGGGHSCAILGTQELKCWGHNDRGQLGLGDTFNRGDEPGEMGDNLPAVDLGTGRTAVALGASLFSTCAVLDDATVKCWGDNVWGQLGLGDQQARGDQIGEMGNNLPTVDLGPGQKAVSLANSGALHQCAVLASGALKCWGSNGFGRLGLGDIKNRGFGPNQMGDDLLTVKLFSEQW